RVAVLDGNVAAYLHRRASDLPPAVGVLVEYTGADENAARGVAMQIAAMRPQYLTRDDVPAELIEKERAIAEATAREEGKPDKAVPKIVEGRLNGYFKEVALLGQPSVTDTKKSVKMVIDEAGIDITRFAHIEIGVKEARGDTGDRRRGRRHGAAARRPQIVRRSVRRWKIRHRSRCG